MEHRNSVLIVEDDVNINGLLKEALEKEGYICTQAFSGTEARMILQGERYSVILLDLMLPGIPGEEVLRDIRKKGNTPVIILTAKDTIDDKVEFLRGGADDYVTKPFRMQELLVRIQALLRRTAKSGHGKKITGELELDINRCHIFKNKKSVELSTTEWRIAAVLIEHYPAAVSREELLYQVWDKDAMYVEENTLNVNISRVREKLGRYDGQQYIETVRGIGYRWSVDVK